MVKNKRFHNVNEDIFQYGEWYCSARTEHCADVIATALNELTSENKELKQKVETLTAKIDRILYQRDRNEKQNVKIMGYLHDAHYDIFEEVNKECY